MFLMEFYSPKVYVVFPSSRVSVGCSHACRGGPEVLKKQLSGCMALMELVEGAVGCGLQVLG